MVPRCPGFRMALPPSAMTAVSGSAAGSTGDATAVRLKRLTGLTTATASRSLHGFPRPDSGVVPRTPLPPQVREVVEAIQNKYRPERIILFGSYAWGQPTRDSDVDLFIVKATLEPPRQRRTRLRMLIQREKRGLPVDLLVYTPSEVDERLAMADPFVEQILREGVVLPAS